MSTTRKILSMSYRPGSATPDVNAEPCAGDCYAEDHVLRETGGESWTTEQLRVVFSQLMRVHAGTCGNQNFRIGIDLDERRGLYVGSFHHFGAAETVVADSLLDCVGQLHGVATAYFATPRYRADLAESGGLRRGACAHGEDQALLDWMLVAGGFGSVGSIRVADLVAS